MVWLFFDPCLCHNDTLLELTCVPSCPITSHMVTVLTNDRCNGCNVGNALARTQPRLPIAHTYSEGLTTHRDTTPTHTYGKQATKQHNNRKHSFEAFSYMLTDNWPSCRVLVLPFIANILGQNIKGAECSRASMDNWNPNVEISDEQIMWGCWSAMLSNMHGYR